MITRMYTIEGGSLDYDPSIPCIIATYIGFATLKDIIEQNEYGLEIIQKKIQADGKVAWISDLSKSEIFDEESILWAKEYWNTAAYCNGLRFHAVISPTSAFSMLNLEEYMKENDTTTNNLVTKLFTDIGSALTWCKEMLSLVSEK